MHTIEDVERTLEAFSEVADKLNSGYYNDNKFSPK
jgi:glycine C-acetyltransferase